ncbi:PrnB family protein [Bradyrhizobium sp.]|uniref:PrnB family protein n=1 Tax=Bradyrhizobium sp. TaxID=376 RepID=UPI0039E24238
MRERADAFDRWIRTSFVEQNTALENLYFAQPHRAQVRGIGRELKQQLRDEGHAHIVGLLQEVKVGDGFAAAFDLLGNVGMYLGAMRRHELTNPAREQRSPFPEASALAIHVAASIGMVPRFVAAHLTTHNMAFAGARKSFTALSDESLFIDENTRGILAFQKAADALIRIVPLGISSPVNDVLFDTAKHALAEAVQANERLLAQMDIDRFFFCVRPYYKPYRIGRQEYRGANAGDFSGINEIDLLLGLCRASDPHYGQLLLDKMLFLRPEEQTRLRECMSYRSLLDELLAVADDHAAADWFQRNARSFLEVCDVYARTARQHHDLLVKRFIECPAGELDERDLEGLTSSGPPLPILMRSLEMLRDLRAAANRGDLSTRSADLAKLRTLLGRQN